MKKVMDKPHSVFSRGSGFNYAGTHLLIEFWEAEELDSLKTVEAAFTEAVEACGATLLEIRLHHFSPFGGVSGVAVLKESHMSIHTWPEFGYAAIDVFMCGQVDPGKSIDVLKRYFKPKKVQIMEIKRGIFDDTTMVF